MEDYSGTYDTIEEAKESINTILIEEDYKGCDGGCFGHIYDTEINKIVWEY